MRSERIISQRHKQVMGMAGDLTYYRRLVSYLAVRWWLPIMISLFCVALSIFWPIRTSVEPEPNEYMLDLQFLDETTDNLGPLMVEIAGRRLIRPSEIQAAVRDTGAADRLLSKLELVGIVEVDEQRVAYIKVEKKRIKTVAEGENIIGFVVDSIVPGKVLLSLDGVEIELAY